jgi:von Willebrand factor type D domain
LFLICIDKDPHFITLDGTKFSYHGECDLVMIKNPKFDGDLGLSVHIRTEIVTSWSLISNAAIRIGSDSFELVNNGNYYYNGVESAELPQKLAGRYNISKSGELEGEASSRLSFEINMLGGHAIRFSINKGMISVKASRNFGSIGGLLGIDGISGVVGRDGKNQLSDPSTMADEWQVNDDDNMLFHDIRAPQYPEKCKMPLATSNIRRLRRDQHLLAMAEIACKDVDTDFKDFCIEDILQTNDITLANEYLEGIAA